MPRVRHPRNNHLNLNDAKTVRRLMAYYFLMRCLVTAPSVIEGMSHDRRLKEARTKLAARVRTWLGEATKLAKVLKFDFDHDRTHYGEHVSEMIRLLGSTEIEVINSRGFPWENWRSKRTRVASHTSRNIAPQRTRAPGRPPEPAYVGPATAPGNK